MPLADHRVVEIKARRGQSGRTVLLWTDVTAARAQLARLQEAVALSAEAFAFYDAGDRLILANDLYAHLCGVKTLDELIGKTFPEIAARAPIPAASCWMRRRNSGWNAACKAIAPRPAP